MSSSSTQYELPDNTEALVRRMVICLGLFFAALLLVVALVMYYAQSLAQYIPFSAEKRFVRPYENLVSRFFPDKTGEPEVTAYLRRLSHSLAQTMQLPEDVELQVHYVDFDMVNAFATLGGHVFIFRGLLENMPDENSLAMVLAHEIAHIRHRDPIASVSRGMALQMLIGLVLGGGTSAEDFMNVAGGSGLALFSREQERQADLAALNALHYREFFEWALEMESTDRESFGAEDDVFADLMASHPATQERLEYLDAEASKFASSSIAHVPLPDLILELIEADY